MYWLKKSVMSARNRTLRVDIDCAKVCSSDCELLDSVAYLLADMTVTSLGVRSLDCGVPGHVSYNKESLYSDLYRRAMISLADLLAGQSRRRACRPNVHIGMG